MDQAKIKVGFGNKQNVKVKVPFQRYPVTLYAPDWMVLLDNIDEIRQFIADNVDELSWGNGGEYENLKPNG